MALLYISFLQILICYLEIGNFNYKVIITLIIQTLLCIFTVLELIISKPEYSSCIIKIISIILGIIFATSETLDIIFYVNHTHQYFLGIYFLISAVKFGAFFGYCSTLTFYYVELLHH